MCDILPSVMELEIHISNMLNEPKTKEARRKLHQSISIKLLKTRDKEKILKAARRIGHLIHTRARVRAHTHTKE